MQMQMLLQVKMKNGNDTARANANTTPNANAQSHAYSNMPRRLPMRMPLPLPRPTMYVCIYLSIDLSIHYSTTLQCSLDSTFPCPCPPVCICPNRHGAWFRNGVCAARRTDVVENHKVPCPTRLPLLQRPCLLSPRSDKVFVPHTRRCLCGHHHHEVRKFQVGKEEENIHTLWTWNLQPTKCTKVRFITCATNCFVVVLDHTGRPKSTP